MTSWVPLAGSAGAAAGGRVAHLVAMARAETIFQLLATPAAEHEASETVDPAVDPFSARHQPLMRMVPSVCGCQCCQPEFAQVTSTALVPEVPTHLPGTPEDEGGSRKQPVLTGRVAARLDHPLGAVGDAGGRSGAGAPTALPRLRVDELAVGVGLPHLQAVVDVARLQLELGAAGGAVAHRLQALAAGPERAVLDGGPVLVRLAGAAPQLDVGAVRRLAQQVPSRHLALPPTCLTVPAVPAVGAARSVQVNVAVPVPPRASVAVTVTLMRRTCGASR